MSRPRFFALIATLSASFLVALCAISCSFDLQQGTACTRTYECQPGLYCDRGTCTDVSSQNCNDNADCPTTSACRFSLCVPRQLLIECDQVSNPCPDQLTCRGGYCTRSGEGSPCQVDNDCANPNVLICDNQFGNVCRVGRRCQDEQDCDQGFFCNQDRCELNRDPTPCSDSSDCQNEDEFCDVDGQCVPNPIP